MKKGIYLALMIFPAALLIATIANGGKLLGVNRFILNIIVGSLIIISVYIDQLSKKRR